MVNKFISCPTCEGRTPLEKKEVCFTCGGTGIVYPGVKCFYCGRSVQRKVNNIEVCMNDACSVEADKKFKPSSSGVQSDADIIEEFKREIGL